MPAFLDLRIDGAVAVLTMNSPETRNVLGLVAQVVPGAQLMDAAMDVARRIAANPPHALRMAKRLMRESQHLRLDTVLELSAAFQALAHASGDHRERIVAAVEAISRKR